MKRVILMTALILTPATSFAACPHCILGQTQGTLIKQRSRWFPFAGRVTTYKALQWGGGVGAPQQQGRWEFVPGQYQWQPQQQR